MEESGLRENDVTARGHRKDMGAGAAAARKGEADEDGEADEGGELAGS
jgi:hypothetical protein